MPRVLWNGTISFGLVNIPITLSTAVKEKTIQFHMLSSDGTCRLRRKLYCPETGKEYDFKETSRGYEVAPDQYVIVNDEELKKLKPDKGKSVVITDFVPLESIDPIYFDRSYYVQPGKDGGNAYRLLVATMMETKRVALAHFVMHEREHLTTLRAHDDVLVLHTMHYADEVTPASELQKTLSHGKVDKRELAVARQLVDALSGEFEPEKYHDEFRREVQEMIHRKSKGMEIKSAPAEEIPPTFNLMDALRQSVAAKGKSRKKKAPAKKTKSAHHKQSA
jgi:DNA end-binding protein Ku